MGEKKSKRTPKTDKEQKEIIAFYLECNNYSETARHFGMSDTGVRKIIKRNAGTESTKQLEEKKNNNTKEVIQGMENRKQVINELLDDIIIKIKGKVSKADEDMFTSIRDLAMAYGTVIDKEFKRKELELKAKELELQEKELESDGNLNGSIIQAITGQIPSIWEDDKPDAKENKEETK